MKKLVHVAGVVTPGTPRSHRGVAGSARAAPESATTLANIAAVIIFCMVNSPCWGYIATATYVNMY
jgi:hypothetical protein